MSPQKVRRVLGLVRGKPVYQAPRRSSVRAQPDGGSRV